MGGGICLAQEGGGGGWGGGVYPRLDQYNPPSRRKNVPARRTGVGQRIRFHGSPRNAPICLRSSRFLGRFSHPP